MTEVRIVPILEGVSLWRRMLNKPPLRPAAQTITANWEERANGHAALTGVASFNVRGYCRVRRFRAYAVTPAGETELPGSPGPVDLTGTFAPGDTLRLDFRLDIT